MLENPCCLPVKVHNLKWPENSSPLSVSWQEDLLMVFMIYLMTPRPCHNKVVRCWFRLSVAWIQSSVTPCEVHDGRVFPWTGSPPLFDKFSWRIIIPALLFAHLSALSGEYVIPNQAPNHHIPGSEVRIFICDPVHGWSRSKEVIYVTNPSVAQTL